MSYIHSLLRNKILADIFMSLDDNSFYRALWIEFMLHFQAASTLTWIKAFREQGANFPNILRAAFLHECVLRSFSFYRFGFVIFWQKNIVKKVACKMLVKLTQGRWIQLAFTVTVLWEKRNAPPWLRITYVFI